MFYIGVARAGTHRFPDEWRTALVAAEREEGLLPYLAKIENATALARTLDDWRRVTTEAITDAVNDGLSALEPDREYEIADDLIDAASADLVRKNALAARFTGPSGTRW
jgi:hypothetical protein